MEMFLQQLEENKRSNLINFAKWCQMLGVDFNNDFTYFAEELVKLYYSYSDERLVKDWLRRKCKR